MEPTTITINCIDLIGDGPLAKALERDKKTLANMRKQGLPFYQVGRTIVYQLSEVLNWLGQHNAKAGLRIAKNLAEKTKHVDYSK